MINFGQNAVDTIKNNPYILVDISYGVDFFKIDKIALDLGIEIDSYERVKAGIKYALLLASYNGNTCLQKEILIKFVKDRLNIEEKHIEENLISLKASEEIVYEKRDDDTEWYYLKPLFEAEKNVAERIYMMTRTKNIKYIDNFEKELLKQEKTMDIILSEKQKEALNSVNENNVSIITGGPRNSEKLQL